VRGNTNPVAHNLCYDHNLLALISPVCYRGSLIVLIRSTTRAVVSSSRPHGWNSAPIVFAGAVLSCVVLAVIAGDASAVDLQIHGEYRIRAFDMNNVFDARSGGNSAAGCGTPPGSCNDQMRFIDQRFRLTTTAGAGITSGVVTLDFLNTNDTTRPTSYLTEPSVSGSGTGDYRFGTAGFGGSLNAVGVREAYLEMAFPELTLIAGRQHVVLGHSIVYDDVADGVTAVLPVAFWHGQLSVSALEIFNDNATMPFGSGNNTNLYLVNMQMNPSPPHAFNVYGGVLRDRGPTLLNGLIYGAMQTDGVPLVPPGTNLSPATGTVFLAGAAYDTRVGPSTFSFEFDAMRGFIDSVPAAGGPVSLSLEGFDLMAAQTIDTGPVTLGLMIVYASGSGQDDFGEVGKSPSGINMTDISPNFVLGNILVNNEAFSDRDGTTLQNGGFLCPNGTRAAAGQCGALNQGGAGLIAVKLSAGGEVAQGLRLDGAAIYAKTVDPVIPNIDSTSPNYCTPTYGPPPPGSPPNPSCKVDDRLGWELDLNASYQADANLMIKAGGAFLIADNAFSGLYNNDFTKYDSSWITKLYVKVVYRF
jgi:hypothetical protein